MPKAKISQNAALGASSAQRTPVKITSTGTPLWYKIIMLTLMVAGLLWLVVYYLAGPQISFMVQLQAWNYLIGFALFILGLLMTTAWR